LPRLPSKPSAERTVRDFAAFAVVLFFDELLLRELWAALLVKANPAYGLGSPDCSIPYPVHSNTLQARLRNVQCQLGPQYYVDITRRQSLVKVLS